VSAEASVLAPALKRLSIRAAREDDLSPALALLEFERQKNPWLDRTEEFFREAAVQPSKEYRACVAEREGELVGFAVYGMIAGAVGTGALYSVLVAPRSRRAGIGHRLLSHAASDLSTLGARIMFAEVPGDPYLVRYRALLLAHGFFEETRIDDYYRDGTPQIISRLDL
jgi:ribosomal protein S18 acetylase RimI-like enzyme